MNNSKKAPIVLNVSLEAKKAIDKIEETHYFDLHNAMTSRTNLFLFAMALGLETVPTDFTQKESFVRVEYFTVHDEALLYSAFINQIEDKDSIDECVENDKVFDLAQKYANTGFTLIDNMIETKPESMAILEMIEELDNEYEKISNKNF